MNFLFYRPEDVDLFFETFFHPDFLKMCTQNDLTTLFIDLLSFLAIHVALHTNPVIIERIISQEYYDVNKNCYLNYSTKLFLLGLDWALGLQSYWYSRHDFEALERHFHFQFKSQEEYSFPKVQVYSTVHRNDEESRANSGPTAICIRAYL